MTDFENQNEESFCMVRSHRDCYPKGERVLLASEEKVKAILRESATVKLDLKNANIRADEAEARVRAWHVITAAASSLCAVCGFLIGFLI